MDHNLMVVGKPGSGKTTYLQRVITECNAGNLQAHRIPALIRLREFIEDGQSLSYSLERYLEQCWQLSSAETQLVLKHGRSLVLLDGLDEITGKDGKSIIKQIKQFARGYPQVQIVITCRTQSFSGETDWKSLRFNFVEVADFNEVQVRLFIEHWFKTVVQDETVTLEESQEFLEQLFREENKPIRELAVTPILLSLTCAVFHQTGRFYSKHSKLYEEGLELLLEQWDKSREIKRNEIYRNLSVKQKLKLLSYLAVKKFEQPQYVLFKQEELEEYIAEFFKEHIAELLEIEQLDSQVVLKSIAEQHGLLIERSHKIWSFSHLTFQEYLAAYYFHNIDNKRKISKHVTDLHWRQVFLIRVDMLEDADRFILDMKNSIDYFLKTDEEIQAILLSIFEKAQFSPSVRAYQVAHILCAEAIELLTRDQIDFLLDPKNEMYFEDYNFINKLVWASVQLELMFEEKLESFEENDFSDMFDLPLILAPTYDYEKYIKSSQKKFMKSARKLQECLVELLEKLPLDICSDKDEVREWIRQEKGNSWLKDLRGLIAKYQEIFPGWNLNRSQKEMLRKYYDANKLLLECLNGNFISTSIRHEIHTTLLLPIAEIEKRRCETLE